MSTDAKQHIRAELQRLALLLQRDIEIVYLRAAHLLSASESIMHRQTLTADAKLVRRPLVRPQWRSPAKAGKLRAAGIKDVETLLATDTAKLVEVAGFDAKREAAAVKKSEKEIAQR
jgi:hypothetical protein